MKTIYLVRHGETLANRQGILQGWSNNPLDDTGRKQASALVTRAARVPLDALYTSDLIRTRETAAPLAAARGMEAKALPGLREISFGKWDGHHLREIQEKDQDTLRDIFLKPGQVDLEAEEDLAASQKRGWETFRELVDQMEPEGTILCVSHGGLIRLLVCQILGFPIDNMWRMSLANTAFVQVVQTADYGFRVDKLNDMGML
ncbi:histidine phosphatase family protein [Acidaminococcus fermentans]|uniref:histidine phosphatase family protein n=1 Tax=Acidaminococcus fermentans TaxID=905 RepID=UPI002E772A22|nr:histidine phosphatase family protein [Acidaminococcus fermentans]MEE1597717.1 histidine phosphatase family protein [Acidaminococcus fermentans]MEE4121979.1 histidine phosphatase family protein [Acidaminococcus fermentans]